MKASIQRLVAVTFSMFLAVSCIQDPPVPIPDLNPGTPEGGDILIYDINDAIVFNSTPINGNESPRFRNFVRNYDLFDDGTIDLTLRGDNIAGGLFTNPNSFLRLRFSGEILRNSYNQVGNDLFDFPDDIVWLPVQALTGGSMPSGNWAPQNNDFNILSEGKTEGIGPWEVNTAASAGIHYIATRTKSGGNYYYGWIEIAVSDVDDADPEELLFISRFGISTTPGLRVRMGEE
jgi:hypothetical protein